MVDQRMLDGFENFAELVARSLDGRLRPAFDQVWSCACRLTVFVGYRVHRSTSFAARMSRLLD